ncbi:MAG: hypothetical protein D9N14_02780 [Ketobacter sp.]|nr:MAG: hypothetical protein D9N14_02780 [Ketobacter sp.]
MGMALTILALTGYMHTHQSLFKGLVELAPNRTASDRDYESQIQLVKGMLCEHMDAKNYIAAHGASGMLAGFFWHRSVQRLSNYSPDEVDWQDFALAFEYARVSIELYSRYKVRKTEFNSVSFSNALALALYGVISNKAHLKKVGLDEMDRLLPSRQMNCGDLSDQPYIHNILMHQERGESNVESHGAYGSLIKAANSDGLPGKLTDVMQYHLFVSDADSESLSLYFRPIDILPLDILYCMHVYDFSTNTVLDSFRSTIAELPTASDDLLDEIDIFLFVELGALSSK